MGIAMTELGFRCFAAGGNAAVEAGDWHPPSPSEDHLCAYMLTPCSVPANLW